MKHKKLPPKADPPLAEKKPKQRFSCKCGNQSLEFEYTSQVGELRRRSGFLPMMGGLGNIYWICRDCALKATKMAREIQRILGLDYMHFASLLSLAKEFTQEELSAP